MSPGADEFRLAAGANAGSMPVEALAIAVEGDPIADGPVIGLVDELDDPSPGHMSEHPTALTSTASTTTGPVANVTPVVNSRGTGAINAPGRPMFGGSLQERFVKAASETSTLDGEEPESGVEEGLASDDSDAMAVDEDADKENIQNSG